MDIRKIKKLIEMLQASDLREIEVKEGEESVRIARGAASLPNEEYLIPSQTAQTVKPTTGEINVEDSADVMLKVPSPIGDISIGCHVDFIQSPPKRFCNIVFEI